MTASPGWASQLLATALALGLVLLLAWGVLRALRRFQPGLGKGTADVPQVLHSTAVGPRERLTVVRFRGRDYLLGVAAGGVQLIDRWPAAPSAPDTAIPPDAKLSPPAGARDGPI